jgi:hypothetical protein
MAKKLDFSAAPIVAPQGDQWTALRTKVRLLAAAQTAVERLEAELEVAKGELATYRDKEVPEHAKAMGWAGGEVDGYQVTIKPSVFGGIGSLKEDPVAQASAYAYLEELNEGRLIKRTLTISMGKDSAPIENRLRDAIAKVQAEVKVPLELVSKMDVNASQLHKVARDRLDDGDNIDLPRLGLVSVRRASVKPAK